MKLTGKEAQAVVWEENDDWTTVSEENIVENSRWSIQVFEHLPTKKTYQFHWREGATENQPEEPFEGDDFYEPQEVVQKEVKVMQWVKA